MEGINISRNSKDIDYLPEILSRTCCTTGGHFGIFKIAEGCDKHCTYCIIPKFAEIPKCSDGASAERGKGMADEGVKELILVAQETTVYGTDLYGKKLPHILLKDLCKIKGIRWIRLLYCYPEEITMS